MQRLRDEYDQKISQKGAGKKITALESNGYITGYTPIANLALFGSAYFVTVQFDDSYRDIPSYLDSIESFLEMKKRFASIASFMNGKTLQFSCVIITENFDSFYQGLLAKVALNTNIVEWGPLTNIRGIPDYGKDSMPLSHR